MAEKYAGKLHLLKEDIKEKWGEVKETGIKTTVSNNVNVSIPLTLLKMWGKILLFYEIAEGIVFKVMGGKSFLKKNGNRRKSF
jgi:hypothetical protein